MDISINTFNTSGDRALLDPRTSIYAIIVISVVMIGGRLSGIEYILRVISCMIPVVFLFAKKNYKLGMIYFLLALLAMIIERSAIQTSSGFLNLLLVIISGTISRFVPQFMMAYCFMSYTKVSELIVSLEKMHLPDVVIISLAVMFRFFPTIAEENRCVVDAMNMRKTKTKKFSLIERLEYQIVPIMMQSVRIADELSQAAMTKGLGINIHRTHICEVGFRYRDYLMIILLTAILLLFFIY